MQHAYVIVGPTATGKTALALQIAQKNKGVLFSADSIQVYQDLDIISGKDLPILKDASIHLLDIVPPTTPFSVSNFLNEFSSTISRLSPDAVPIIVGGTGFYVSAILDGVDTANIKPNYVLREKFERATINDLQEKLRRLDSVKLESMNNSDMNNSRRLMRAIEVAVSRKEDEDVKHYEKPLERYALTIIGLTASSEFLNKRIDRRVKQRMEEGAVEEARTLFKNYENLAPQVKTANGYKQLFGYLKGEHDLPTAIELWKTAEHQNAKKQMTRFKKDTRIQWFDIEKISPSELSAKLALNS